MKIFLFLLRRARRELVLTTCVMTLAGLGVSGLIFLVNASVTRGSVEAQLFGAFLGLAAVIIVSRTVGSYLLARLMARSLLELRMQLARRLMEVPYKQFEDIGGDRALAAITSDISTINAVVGGLPYFLRNAVVALCCFGYMLFVSWQCFVVMLVFVVLGLTWYRLLATRAARHQKLSRLEWDTLFGHFRALVGGIKELKLSSKKRRDFLGTMIEPCETRHQREQLLGATFFTAASSISQALAFVMIGLVLFVLPTALDLPRDVQVTYTLLLVFSMTPLEGIVSWVPTLVSADVAMARVQALGVTLEQGAEKPHGRPAPSSWSAIRLEGVSHTYYRERENEHFTLGPVDLTLLSSPAATAAARPPWPR
jgi:putative pyoverdin transport system ATP-binding/permease protein